MEPIPRPKARIDYLCLYAEDAERALTVKRCFRFLDQPFQIPFSTSTGWLWASDHMGVLCELALE